SEELFSDEIVHEAAKRFNCDAGNAKKLGDFENYVFEVHKGNIPYILRLTHSSHRTKEEVEAELIWINFLHKEGVNVSLVSHSNQGKMVEVIEVKDSNFYVCLFDKAPGLAVKGNAPIFNEQLFKQWGRIIGK